MSTSKQLLTWRANELAFVERQRTRIPDTSLSSVMQFLHPEYGAYFREDIVTNYVFSAPLRPQLCLADRLIVDIHPHETEESFVRQYGVTPDEMMRLIDTERVLPVFHADMERYKGLTYLARSGLWNPTRPSNVRTDALFDMIAPGALAEGMERFAHVEKRYGTPTSKSWSTRYRTGAQAYRKATMVRFARLHVLAPGWLARFKTPPSPHEIGMLSSWFVGPLTKALGCLHKVDERLYEVDRELPPGMESKRVPASELVVARALLAVLDEGRSSPPLERDREWSRDFLGLVQEVIERERLSNQDVARSRKVATQLGVEWAVSARKNRKLTQFVLNGATFLARVAGKSVLSLGAGAAITIAASGLGAVAFSKRYASYFRALRDRWPEVGAWRYFRLAESRDE